MVTAPLPPPHPRRVSYVLPLPNSPPPLLTLPPLGISRKGQTGPLYTSRANPKSGVQQHSEEQGGHPKHRLAVQALALDLSTSLHGENSPEGILYTGGRDGLVCSWELGLPTKRRRHRYGTSKTVDPRHIDHGSDSGNESASSGSDRERKDPRRVPVDSVADELDLEGLGLRPISLKAKRNLRLKIPRRDSSADTRRPNRAEDFPVDMEVEDRWEIDDDRVQSSAVPKARFRQCIQSHTDWVNDIILCDYNRTLVSASSDSLLLAWNPHSENHEDQVTPKKIGTHGDYIRCLAGARDAGWVASGGFDRKIKIWDLAEGRSSAVVEIPSPPASVYSLATTPSGSLLAAGTPERVIRVWDPRSRRQVARLGGHTDNVRGVLIGSDGKWLLSASSDSTVKLWSLAAQKCLHTFSHHSSSVWSLFSQHPNLEVFYSGDRNGNVCKLDIEGCGDLGDGECIVLARDSEDPAENRSAGEGITQLVAQDDSWVWTAGGSSCVKRWKDVAPRCQRAGPIATRRSADVSADTSLDDQSSSIPESPPDSTWLDKDRSGLPSVSFVEVLSTNLTRTSSTPSPRPSSLTNSPLVSGRPSSLRARPTIPQRSRNALESQLSSGHSTPGIVSHPPTLSCIPYDSLVPLTSPDDTYFIAGFAPRIRDPDSTAMLSSASIHSVPQVRPSSTSGRPSLSNSYTPARRPHSVAETMQDGDTQATNIARREYIERESASEATPLRVEPDDIIEGGHGLIRCELLNDRRHALSLDTDGEIALWDLVECRCIGIFAPEDLNLSVSSESSSGASSGTSTRDLLERIRDRVEGEVSVATWCKCDTRVGALTVHLEEARVFDAEVYTDESHLGSAHSFPQDQRLVLGKWVLRNLFSGFIDAEMDLRSGEQALSLNSLDRDAAPTFISLSGLDQPTSLSRPALKTPGMTIALATPALRPAMLPDLPLPTSSPQPTIFFQTPAPQSPLDTPRLQGSHGRPMTPSGAATPTTSRAGGDYFSLLPTTDTSTSLASPLRGNEPALTPSPAPPTSPLPTPGLMGRFRLLGKGSKRPVTGDASDVPPPLSAATPVADARVFHSIEEEQQYRVMESVLSRPLIPCPRVDAPVLPYDANMAVIISEETADASAWAVTYRGLIRTSHSDMQILEEKAPLWLLDFLLGGRIAFKDPVKISFVLQPWMDPVRAGLAEIPNANSRLTANRNLRISKVVMYIADKLDLRHHTISRAPSISSHHTDDQAVLAPLSSPRPPSIMGDFDPSRLEILCGDVLLSSSMSLATVRAYFWKGGGDLTLSYRLTAASMEDY